jgi:hypothetical protein
MTDCDKLLSIFLTFKPKKAEDVNYFKCKALLKLMGKKECKLTDNVDFQRKLDLLINMERTAAAASKNLSDDEEKQFLDAAEKAATQAYEELLASELASELNELNGGSRRRRASKKHSKKHRKSKRSKKTKSRRH